MQKPSIWHRCGWKFCVAAVGALIAAGMAYKPANAETFTLRVGSGHPPVLPYVALLKNYFVPEVKRRVAAETGNKIKFIEAYGGSVAKLTEVLHAVESGLLDIGAMSTVFEPRNLYLQNYSYYVPFGIKDPVKAGQVARQLYDEFPALKKTIEDQGQHLLAVLAASDYQIISRKKFTTLAELKGLKMLAAGANADWLTGTGAVTVQGGLPEAYNSIQSGVVDGELIHYQGMYGFKLYEVAKYIEVMDFGVSTSNLLTINTKRWQSLPANIRKIITEVSHVYEKKVNEANAARDKTAVGKMVKAGAQVVDISPNVRKQWAQLLSGVPEKFANQGKSLGLPQMRPILKRYIEILKSSGNQIVDVYKLD